MSAVRFEVDVPWASEPLMIDGDVFDGEFELEAVYFTGDGFPIFIDIDKLGITLSDYIMDSVYKQLEKRDE